MLHSILTNLVTSKHFLSIMYAVTLFAVIDVLNNIDYEKMLVDVLNSTL